MSVPSGIGPSQSLMDAWTDARKDSKVFALKVAVEDESIMSPAGTLRSTGNSEKDWDALSGFVEPKSPCWLLVRTGSENHMIVLWSPSVAHVRNKMIVASSTEILKKAIGVSEELLATEPSDLGYKAYLTHVASNSAAAPLTDAEKALKAEKGLVRDGAGATSNLHGVGFALSSEAQSGLAALVKKNGGWAAFGLSGETIELKETGSGSVNSIAGALGEGARWIVINWDHKHDGAAKKAWIFVYWCPESAPVRSKMLYSAGLDAMRAAAIGAGCEFAKTLNATEASDMTEDAFDSELYPKAARKTGFSKPSRPGRGTARIVKKT